MAEVLGRAFIELGTDVTAPTSTVFKPSDEGVDVSTASGSRGDDGMVRRIKYSIAELNVRTIA